jgi:phosphonoacetaldehyde hydrolase
MTHHKPYTGTLKAVIFDWAGTTIDYGCFAPVAVFIEVFRRQGIEISIAQARAPMGLEKKDHIRAIAQQPEVSACWRAAKGRACDETDVEAMYRDSLELQYASVLEYAELIPGTLDTIHYCRAQGLKIGTSTGYNRTIMNKLLSVAAYRGYIPDAALCPSDVAAGRPAPWMIFQNAMQLGVYPMPAVVKVGDTLPDIEEGLNAGVWTIGVSQTGNELGLSQAEVKKLTEDELAARLAPIETRLRDAGAHYVARSIAEVPAILDDIETRLQTGEQP